jgi:LPS-assembly lipoprotein
MWLSKILYSINLKILGLLRRYAPRNDDKNSVIASGAKQSRNKISSRKLGISILSFCFFLTACGFHPLYMPHNESSDICYSLKIATIPDRHGQILRNYLLDMLTPEGQPPKPRYTLAVKLTESVTAIGINKDETTSRKQAILTALITLRDNKKNVIICEHSTKAINDFAIISKNYYSDMITEDYAEREAIRLLAEKICLILTTYLDIYSNEN